MINSLDSSKYSVTDDYLSSAEYKTHYLHVYIHVCTCKQTLCKQKEDNSLAVCYCSHNWISFNCNNNTAYVISSEGRCNHNIIYMYMCLCTCMCLYSHVVCDKYIQYNKYTIRPLLTHCVAAHIVY